MGSILFFLKIEIISLKSKVRKLEKESKYPELFEEYEKQISSLTAQLREMQQRCADAEAARDICNAQQARASCSGPKKTVHRIGRQDDTYAFVVVHNGFVSQCIYHDHQGVHKTENDTVRFGTLHVLLNHRYSKTDLDLCIGVVSVRKDTDGKDTFDKCDAQMLAY